MTPFTMCKFDFSSLPQDFHKQYPFTDKDVFIYLNDIKQMPGHCVVVRTRDNSVFTCYDTDNFIELSTDEV